MSTRRITLEELQRIATGVQQRHQNSGGFPAKPATALPSLEKAIPPSVAASKEPPPTTAAKEPLVKEPLEVADLSRIAVKDPLVKEPLDELEETSVAEAAAYAVGLDEAGKGCVLGPLFVGIVVWRIPDLVRLEKLGAQDSKKVKSDARRTAIRNALVAEAVHHDVVCLEASELVQLSTESRMTMNSMDEMLFARALETIPAALRNTPGLLDLYMDAAEANEERFAQSVLLRLTPRTRRAFAHVVSKNKADGTYRVVGAASIIAKHAREKWVSEAHLQWGDFGSGYCESRTFQWMKTYYRTHGRWPTICRTTWKTCERLLLEIKQGK